jgi:hypothetical protein
VDDNKQRTTRVEAQVEAFWDAGSIPAASTIPEPCECSTFECCTAGPDLFADLEGRSPALVHRPNSRQLALANASLHILTANETGIPSSAMRLRMLHPSRASTDCSVAQRTAVVGIVAEDSTDLAAVFSRSPLAFAEHGKPAAVDDQIHPAKRLLSGKRAEVVLGRIGHSKHVDD